MDRGPGLSVRLKLALSYAGVIVLAGALLLAVVWVFLLRYVPEVIYYTQSPGAPGTPGPMFIPDRSDLLRAFAPKAVAALAFLLVFGLLGGWILAGHMLAPLTRITNATRLAADGSLSHRVQLEGRKDEFRELADAFDTMLARLEAHDAEQQRFAANASHELRTPLAITQTLLEVARDDPNANTGELVDRLHFVNTRAIDLTEALLLLSRADRRSFTREHVDLSLIAEEATETLVPLAERRGLTIETSGDITPTIGSHALLLQMTTNLVHNAIVHNLPEQGTVWVTTGVHPTTVVLSVENTGEKLSPDLASTLVEPFQRGTERIRADHAGVGLGLAIVRSIAHAHDGTLILTPPGRRRAPRHGATTRRTTAHRQMTNLRRSATAAAAHVDAADLRRESGSTDEHDHPETIDNELERLSAPGTLGHAAQPTSASAQSMHDTYGDQDCAEAQQERPPLLVVDRHRPEESGDGHRHGCQQHQHLATAEVLRVHFAVDHGVITHLIDHRWSGTRGRMWRRRPSLGRWKISVGSRRYSVAADEGSRDARHPRVRRSPAPDRSAATTRPERCRRRFSGAHRRGGSDHRHRNVDHVGRRPGGPPDQLELG